MAFPFASRPIWDGVPLGFDKAGNPISYNKSADGSGNAQASPGAAKATALVLSSTGPGERHSCPVNLHAH